MMENYRSKRLKEIIEKALDNANAKYWDCFAKDNTNTFFENETRYNALYELVCDKEKEYSIYLDFVNPITTIDPLDYLDSIGKFSVATECKILLCDQHLSKDDLLKVEETFCKVFGVRYYEEACEYL